EDRAQFETGEDVLDECGVDAGGEDTIHRHGEAVLFLLVRQVLDAVDLLGDVGQIEVGRERPHQLDGLLEVERLEETIQPLDRFPAVGLASRLGQAAHLLHQLEESGAVLARQRLPELGSQPTYVGAECLVPVDHPEEVIPLLCADRFDQTPMSRRLKARTEMTNKRTATPSDSRASPTIRPSRRTVVGSYQSKGDRSSIQAISSTIGATVSAR